MIIQPRKAGKRLKRNREATSDHKEDSDRNEKESRLSAAPFNRPADNPVWRSV
jgi:hypothetical protein